MPEPQKPLGGEGLHGWVPDQPHVEPITELMIKRGVEIMVSSFGAPYSERVKAIFQAMKDAA